MSATTADNDGAGLVNFNPPTNPIINQKKGTIGNIDNDVLNRRAINQPTIQPVNSGKPQGNYAPNNLNVAKLSNYQTSYETSNSPYYSKMGIGHGMGQHGMGQDKIMEKINYLIHMLEAERDEKNDNIMQDFMLYTFLGIFIIFICDSFSRGGRYVR